MAIEKPLPLMVGNKAYYTLSSYEPVEIEVSVPLVTEDDIDLGLSLSLAEVGGTAADLEDPAWLAEHFEGLNSAQQVREAMRQELAAMNQEMGEQQKVGKCVEALTKRLLQSVPQPHIDEVRELVRARFVEQIQADGLTPQQFMTQSHTTPDQLERMFADQARQACEGDAALSAYAHEKKLKVSEEEFGGLFGMDSEAIKSMTEQARATGSYDELQETALRNKALRIVVAECSCTYHHETPAEARARLAQYRQMQELFSSAQGEDAHDGQDSESEHHTGFKLV